MLKRKTSMNKIYASFILFLIALSASAQDKIYKKGGEIIEARISEVGTNEIKYKVFHDETGPVYTIEKDRIIKVVYQNGRTEIYQNSLKDPELYADQAKNAFKVNFLAPLLGYTQFNFEHNLRPGRSYELSLGIIGLGKRQEAYAYSVYDPNTSTSTMQYREARGVFLSGGYKFAKMPDYLNSGAKYSHVMQGFYAKPEFSFGVYGQNNFRQNTNNFTTIDRKTVVFSGLIVNLGKQWVLGDMFLIDAYAGLGYAFDNNNSLRQQGDAYYYEDYVGNHFALATNTDSGFGGTAGIKIGFLFR